MVAAAPVATAAAEDDTPPWDPPAAKSEPVSAPAPGPAPEQEPEPDYLPAQDYEPEPELSVASVDADIDTGDARVRDAGHWLELVSNTGLSGPSQQLAANAAFVSHQGYLLRLSLGTGFEYLRSERALADLAQVLEKKLGHAPKLQVDISQEMPAETLNAVNEREKDQRQEQAEQIFMSHPTVQQLVQQHAARVVPDSIRPYQE